MNIFYKFAWRSLKKNRARTWVTILGVLLSTALTTAVTTSIAGFYDFLVQMTGDEYGFWHLYLDNLTEDQVSAAEGNPDLVSPLTMYNIGYAKLEKRYVSNRPYLYVGAYDGNLDSVCNFALQAGRMPRNSSEIILPMDLEEQAGVKISIGEKLSLDLGVRKEIMEDEAGVNEWKIWRFNSFSASDDGGNEIWEKTQKREYTVVGKYRSGMFEALWLAGFTGLTRADEKTQAESCALFSAVRNPGDYGDDGFLDKFRAENDYTSGEVVQINRNYMMITDNVSFSLKAMIVGMAVILALIIMFSSVALIYNSFSISFNEKKKQYGLLSSVGATRWQLKKCMFFEAAVLGAAGIPLGALAGIGGISAMFYLLGDTIDGIFKGGADQTIHLRPSGSLLAVAVSAAVGFVSILISAWLPARKAIRVSAIEAIRQNDEIRIPPRKLRTSKLARKLFGLEGTLALKNFRRNRRKYRSTVFSLFISIVLFVSATSFCDYLEGSLADIIDRYDADLECRVGDRKDLDEAAEILSIDGVTRMTKYLDGNIVLKTKGEFLSDEEKEKGTDFDEKNNIYGLAAYVYFIDGNEYKKFLSEQGLEPSAYMDAQNPLAVAYGSCVYFDSDKDAYVTYNVFADNSGGLSPDQPMPLTVTDGDGKISKPAKIGAVVEEVPFGLKTATGAHPELFYPMSALKYFEAIFPAGTNGAENENKSGGASALEAGIAFGAKNPDDCASRMQKILEARDRQMFKIYNLFAEQQQNAGLMMLIRVFSLVFITLITLIALANAFNTIATNISLRQREFAVLRSIGMTEKEFRRMMDFECIFYGFKGILYGLPASLLVTYGIYRAIRKSIQIRFFVSWYGVVIAAGGVFLIVFAAMLYSVRKSKTPGMVELLKEDSI